MGKKSRRNNKIGLKNSATATDDASTRNLPQVLIDGRMVDRAGRRFYDYLTFLAEIAMPLLEKSRQKHLHLKYAPLGWKKYNVNYQTEGFASNSFELRDIVMTYILTSIDELIEEINSCKYDALFISIFRRKLTENDKKEIGSWKLHVMDDFFTWQQEKKKVLCLFKWEDSMLSIHCANRMNMNHASLLYKVYLIRSNR